MADRYRLGSWTFDPELGTLALDGNECRLENRASRLLELLCQCGDRLVSHDEIINKVWNGRSTSPNSVAVVIADIRRALSDPARQPIYIETVPKRGYRLMIHPERHLTNQKTQYRPKTILKTLSAPWLFAFFASMIILASSVVILARGDATIENRAIHVSPIENLTGEHRYAPLSAAISDLVLVELMRDQNIRVVDEAQDSLQLSGRVILWDGHPAVSLKAINAADETVWSGMARGPESKLPSQIRRELSEFVKATVDID